MADSQQEIEQGERFAFGENWSLFLQSLNEQRIQRAEQTLRDMLQVDNLEGRRFLDVGSGSGLFSLAARRMGGEVYSFDYDPQSVACTQELKRRYFPDDNHWTVTKGSILDKEFLAKLGHWDVVYSWGVLHHTGQMWQALGNVASLVRPDGKLFIAIYNDEGNTSRRWMWVKRTYNKHPWSRPLLLGYGFCRAFGWSIVADLIRLQPFQTLRNYHTERGMSPMRDLVDWVGGWPFEVARPEAIFDFYRQHGFAMQTLVTRQGRGCNEFVFVNSGES